jgi:hypothetical protein
MDYGPSRLTKMLQCPCHPQISQGQRQRRLAAAVSTLNDLGPVAAYKSLGSNCWVPHLGPAFYSKFLYFADATIDRGARRIEALIIDSTTAHKMIRVSHEYVEAYGLRYARQDEAVSWVWDRSNWSSQRYMIYCQWAANCSNYMVREHRWPPHADMIELALFQM